MTGQDLAYGKNLCGVYYEWQEEPGDQSRVLEWVRVCPKCGFSPDRRTT